jgi:hypothetical protein
MYLVNAPVAQLREVMDNFAGKPGRVSNSEPTKKEVQDRNERGRRPPGPFIGATTPRRKRSE